MPKIVSMNTKLFICLTCI